ncbi:hypothetical protein GCM10007304_01120 [Rhodococcoides trifolii]|uniref:Uncharacterized protein n=1 Tax=Rhodococcoides trifolii TaxID=908250 RepID=A0A917CN70_9NOCA|nr:hypothetical protein [Rhodococcus trifolii]GGF90949.1 hypothetical protein GCM10007304_01120 [Rhodococcus trifolii]
MPGCAVFDCSGSGQKVTHRSRVDTVLTDVSGLVRGKGRTFAGPT